jgi:hypothetical protein
VIEGGVWIGLLLVMMVAMAMIDNWNGVDILNGQKSEATNAVFINKW